MRAYITSHCIANTIRMGGTQTPVFIAESDDQLRLLARMLKENWRFIPTHSRENAIGVLENLLQSGWKGLVTIAYGGSENEGDFVRSNPPTKDSEYDYVFEGNWDEIAPKLEGFRGRTVRLTVIPSGGNGNKLQGREDAGDVPAVPLSDNARKPNQKLLEILKKIDEIHKRMNPTAGRDSMELLREAREGGMYGYGPEK